MACIRCHGPDNGAQFCPSCELLVEQEQNRDDELEIGRPRAEGYSCWFADTFPDVGSRDWAGPCEGRLVRCHLVPRQTIRREAQSLSGDKLKAAVTLLIHDTRSWVYGCGGAMGNAGHHGQYRPDGPRKIPRHLLPPGVEEFAADLGLTWWLERTYGMAEDAA